MNILVLEDRSSVSYYMKEALNMEGHKVLDAHNIYEAQKHWGKENAQIDCIIADLNMNPEGLKLEEMEETVGGMLTGWVWLQKYVFRTKPHMKHRTIIYSDFKDELEENIKELELQGVRRISKSDPSGSAIQLLNYLKEIAS